MGENIFLASESEVQSMLRPEINWYLANGYLLILTRVLHGPLCSYEYSWPIANPRSCSVPFPAPTTFPVLRNRREVMDRSKAGTCWAMMLKVEL